MKKRFEAFLLKLNMKKCTWESIKYEGKLISLIYIKVILLYFLWNFLVSPGWTDAISKILILLLIVIITLIFYLLFNLIKNGRLHCCTPDFNKENLDEH